MYVKMIELTPVLDCLLLCERPAFFCLHTPKQSESQGPEREIMTTSLLAMGFRSENPWLGKMFVRWTVHKVEGRENSTQKCKTYADTYTQFVGCLFDLFHFSFRYSFYCAQLFPCRHLDALDIKQTFAEC